MEASLLLALGVAIGATSAVVILELTIGRRRAGALADLLDRLWSSDPDAQPSPPPASLRDPRLRLAYGRLSARLAAAETMVAADLLTGLPGRLATLELLAGEVERAVRDDRPITVAVLEVDDLREINDRYGQACGDAVLREVARVLRSSLRSLDLCGRIAGNQFLIGLPETGPETGRKVVDKLCARVAETAMPAAFGGPARVTLSCGLAGGEGRGLVLERVLASADAALSAVSGVVAEPDATPAAHSQPVRSASRDTEPMLTGSGR